MDITTAHAECYLVRATSELEEKIQQMRRNKAFGRFRNREIAHAAIEMKGEDPTFGHLATAIDSAANMQRSLRFLLLGPPGGVDAIREALRREHYVALRAVAAAASGESHQFMAASEQTSEVE